jgi:hypothetical protein
MKKLIAFLALALSPVLPAQKFEGDDNGSGKRRRTWAFQSVAGKQGSDDFFTEDQPSSKISIVLERSERLECTKR